nr:MAG TPA: hypothetical protein [Caudoviricetes sp.]
MLYALAVIQIQARGLKPWAFLFLGGEYPSDVPQPGCLQLLS